MTLGLFFYDTAPTGIYTYCHALPLLERVAVALGVHATGLVHAAGRNILADPIWSDHSSPLPPLGPKRVAQPGVRFDDLPKIDLILVRHNHYDHMDIPTLKRL